MVGDVSGVLLNTLWILIGVSLGLWGGLWIMQRLRKSNRHGGVALASALFFSFGFVDPRGRDLIEETSDETKRRKGDQSGDPPTPGLNRHD